MADDNTAEAAGGDLAALTERSRGRIREQRDRALDLAAGLLDELRRSTTAGGAMDLARRIEALARLRRAAETEDRVTPAVPRSPHFDSDAPAGSPRWISDRVEDIVGGDCGMAAAIGDALSDDLAPHLAAPASETAAEVEGPVFTVDQVWFGQVLAAAQITSCVPVSPDDIVMHFAGLEKRRVETQREADGIGRNLDREHARVRALRKVVADLAAALGEPIPPTAAFDTPDQIEVVGDQLRTLAATPREQP